MKFKEYYVVIIDKSDKKHYFYFDNLKEIDNELNNFRGNLKNFEIYKTIDIDEHFELLKLELKRFLDL